jgi:hypothetical protein
MLERLMNEDIKPEELEIEIKRSKAICAVIDKKIANSNLVLKAVKMVSNGEIKKDFIPENFDLKQLK